MVRSSRKAWLTIIVTVILTGLMGYQIPSIIIDNDIKNYLPHTLPDYKTMEDADKVYGSEILMDVALQTTGKTILTASNVKEIRSLSKDIKNLAHVDDVQSLTNIDFLTAVDGGMEARSLVPDDFTGTAEEVEQLKKDIVDWQSMYDKVIISKDRKGSQVVITIDKDITPHEMDVLYDQVAEIVQKYNTGDLKVTMAGDPVLSQMARRYMNTDLAHLIPLVTLVVLICLLLSFKKLEGMLLPVITVLISTIWTVGLMAVTGVHFTVVSSCLPVVLIAVGSAYGIHVLNHYYEMIAKEHGTVSKERQSEIVRESMKKIKGPVILAGITTIAGFISTITSPIIPLKTFALFSAIGVTIALLLSLYFIPALLIVKPLGAENRRIKRRLEAAKTLQDAKEGKTTNNRRNLVAAKLATRSDSWHKSFVGSFYGYLAGNRSRLIFFFVVIMGLSFWGLSRLNVESAIINYFPASSSIRQDAKMIDENFAGSNTFNFSIEGTKAGDLTNPEILQDMDDLSTYLTGKYPQIGKIISFSDFIKRMNQVMHVETEASAETTEETTNTGAAPDSFFSSDTSSSDTGSAPDSFFSSDTSSSDTGSAPDSFFGSDASSSDTGSAPDSFFSDSADTTGTSEGTTASTEVKPYGSSQMLSQTVTVDQMMALLAKSYARAGGGKNLTVDEFYEALEKELNYNGAAYDEIPTDITKYPVENEEGLKNLISQYLLLYSGSLDQFSNDPLQPSMARMQVQLTTHETRVVADIIADANAYVAAHFPAGYTFKAYGIAELENALTNMITSSQVSSLILAIAIVFLILTLYFHSPIAGLIGAIPLMLSILINFGIMGLAHINLDMVTSLIGSIAIGIGVDYTIHFMSDYHNEWLVYHDPEKATLNTLAVSGKAIVVNAVSVGLGFLVLALSQFVVLRYIGILVAIVMLTSSLTAMTILPAMLNAFQPKFLNRPVAGKAEK